MEGWRLEKGEDRGLRMERLKNQPNPTAVVLDLRCHLRQPDSGTDSSSPNATDTSASRSHRIMDPAGDSMDTRGNLTEQSFLTVATQPRLSSPHLPSSKFQSFPKAFVSFTFSLLFLTSEGLNSSDFSSVCQIHSHEVLGPGRGSRNVCWGRLESR